MYLKIKVDSDGLWVCVGGMGNTKDASIQRERQRKREMKVCFA